jgi:hypothetical protein
MFAGLLDEAFYAKCLFREYTRAMCATLVSKVGLSCELPPVVA